MKDDRFLVITGLSGSGKTVVSRSLEDLGYYCIDNLPAKLIPIFVDLWTRREVEIAKVALVVDIREEGFKTEFPVVLETIGKKISPRLIFLDASDESLINRFSESRRPHPLCKNKSVREGVQMERKQLEGIKKLADEVIDTSETNITQLKQLLKSRFSEKKGIPIQVMIVSFGYKYGIPLDSDIVFDTRFLPNPFYMAPFREKTGKSKKVREYVLGQKETRYFLEKLFDFMDYLMPNFIQEGKSYLTISIGCTGGKHRSVILAERLKEHLRGNKYSVRIHHRDIYK
ncbi:MAG: RNase adapter RapZ [Candidatus Aminicenantes bacterium]|nr:RNase adapter RapZ [Candidatus Aminicenantes bacterium]